MENYSKCLRGRINDYEDRAGDLAVEQHRQQMALRSSEKELEALNDNVERLQSQTEELLRECENVSQLILRTEKIITGLETDSATLGQSIELLQGDAVKRSISLTDKKIDREKRTFELEAKAQQYQAYYESLELVKRIKEADVPFTETRIELSTSVTSKSDEQMERDYAIALEEDKLRNLENSCQTIRSNIEEEMQDLGVESMQECVRPIHEDKDENEEYIRLLHFRLDQLKAVHQQVDCSCGHTYIVKLENDTPA